MTTEQRLVSLGSPLPDLAREWQVEHDGTVFRRLRLAGAEHHRLVDLQGRIWAPDVATPAHQLIAAESCGGLVLGAFRGETPVGLSYAFPAYQNGEVWLHSHQTGVADGSRDRGVGATLKWAQRWLALEGAYPVITWTFDPLQSRNAYFNFAKLGVVAGSYKVDCYGRLPDDANRDLPTDRLWVEWHLAAPAVAARFSAFHAGSGIHWPYLPPPSEPVEATARADVPAGEEAGTIDVIPTRFAAPGVPLPVEPPTVEGTPPTLRLEVPADLDLVRREYGPTGATAWRLAVRQGFTAAFARGYIATDFVTTTFPEGRRSWYVLTRPEADEAHRTHP